VEDYTTEELKEALRAISSLISKCEKAHEKLAHRSSQSTLLKNRIKALRIASSLITRSLEGDGV
jgi:phage-related minor tail protein